MGGFSITNVDLRDARSPEELAQRLGTYAKKLPKGRWILGGDWDHEKWPGTPLPTRQMIDAATPDNPVLVNRTDGHMALANSLALKLAGVTKEVRDVPGGVIVRDAKTGEPTGILKDAAMDLVDKAVPERSFEEKLAAARAATEHAASVGVTSVTDMSAGDDVGLYQLMLERGGLARGLPPLLVLQGTNDDNVTPDMAAKFVDAWRAAEGRAALEIFDGMPHAFVTREPDASHSRRAIKLVVDFVRSRGATT